MSYDQPIHGLDSNAEPTTRHDVTDYSGHTPNDAISGKDQASIPGIFKGGEYPAETVISTFQYPTVFERLPEIAVQICQEIDQAGFPQDHMLTRQMLATAEETGEFLGAVRRFYGMARRTGPWEDVLAEWADVVVTAFVTAVTLGLTRSQMEVAVEEKLAKIFTRGWRESDPQLSLDYDDRVREASAEAAQERAAARGTDVE